MVAEVVEPSSSIRVAGRCQINSLLTVLDCLYAYTDAEAVEAAGSTQVLIIYLFKNGKGLGFSEMVTEHDL